MLTPKSHVGSSQSTSRKAMGSYAHVVAAIDCDNKGPAESPKVNVFTKIAQKLSSPTQKIDLAQSSRNAYERSRRKKSDSVSATGLYSRSNLNHGNQSNSVRNSSVKSQTDSIQDKTMHSVISKGDKSNHSGTNLSYKAQRIDKKSLTIEPKNMTDREAFEMNKKIQKANLFLSPQANVKPREFITRTDKPKRASSKDNGSASSSMISPKNAIDQKSPIRSSRNSNGTEASKDASGILNRVNPKGAGYHKKSQSLQETACSSAISRVGEFPMDGRTASECYANNLSPYEKQEILEFKEIYYVSDRYHKILAKDEKEFDDDKGDYLVIKNDQIRYRYEVLEMLGRGSFGQVLKVYDHKEKEYVALKIIRSQKKFHFQAKIEVKILQYMMKHHGSNYNITGLRDDFIFRNHVCLVFELMSLNLYDFLKKNRFRGFNLNVIRKFAIQILYALKFLSQHKIIHCDLKPENILLKHNNKTGIKLIDFGSSCFETEKLYTYIQSRFYRAPEVILGLNYSSQIDMWSFGCLLYELYIGHPIFPGESEQDQLLCMMEVLGVPDNSLIINSPRRRNFFDDEGNPIIVPNAKGKTRIPGTVPIQSLLKCEDKAFLDLVRCCLVYNPQERYNPNQALAHEWILGGLPPDLQAQHIKLIESTPEKKSSVRIKEEILDPMYAKQRQQQLDSNRNVKMDTEPNNLAWKSPKTKLPLDSIQSEAFLSESRSAEKPRKSEDSQDTRILENSYSKKKMNLNTKQQNEEESVINITINLNDTNKEPSINPKPIKKNHHKSESMTIGAHKKDEAKINLVNNYFYINAASYRSTNRNSRQDGLGTNRETKSKRSLYMNENIGDLGSIGDHYESSNCKSINEVLTSTGGSKAAAKANNNNIQVSPFLIEDSSQAYSAGNIIKNISTIVTDHTKNAAQKPSGSLNNSSHTLFHRSSTLPADPMANYHSVNPTSSSGISGIQITSLLTAKALAGCINSAHHPSKSTCMTNPSLTELASHSSRTNPPLNITSSHHQSLPNNSAININTAGSSYLQNMSQHKSNLSTNAATPNTSGIYKSVNPSSIQHKKSQAIKKVDSLYLNSQGDRLHSNDSITREKFAFLKPSTTTNISHLNFTSNLTNTSTNLSSFILKSPQSTRLAERAARKSILAEKKLNSPSQASQKLQSPKTSETLYSKVLAGAKQQDSACSISPRNLGFSMIKYPVARKK